MLGHIIVTLNCFVWLCHIAVAIICFDLRLVYTSINQFDTSMSCGELLARDDSCVHIFIHKLYSEKIYSYE